MKKPTTRKSVLSFSAFAIHLVEIGLFIAFVFCVGCSTANNADTCQKARVAYEAYVSTSAIREVSDDEKKIAAAAAAVLTVSCGWTSTKGTDANGVPVVTPPVK